LNIEEQVWPGEPVRFAAIHRGTFRWGKTRRFAPAEKTLVAVPVLVISLSLSVTPPTGSGPEP